MYKNSTHKNFSDKHSFKKLYRELNGAEANFVGEIESSKQDMQITLNSVLVVRHMQSKYLSSKQVGFQQFEKQFSPKRNFVYMYSNDDHSIFHFSFSICGSG